MLVNFLNKTRPDYPDLDALNTYSPGELLFYFMSASLNIGLDQYLNLKEAEGQDGSLPSSSREWLELIEHHLDAGTDLLTLQESEYLESIGPYYYSPTNTRFYFYKNRPFDSELLTAADLELLESFHQIKAPEPAVQTYGKNKKTVKRYSRNKDELIRDIRMCQAALSSLDKLNKQINFWEKVLEKRQAVLSHPDLLPVEPEDPPYKPATPDNTYPEGNIFLAILRRKQRQELNTEYQHAVKVYYIRYREYEKGCDRFKAILQSWSDLKPDFLDHCREDCTMAEEKLFAARQYLALYNLILNRSIIHSQYRDIPTLNSFQHYLESGRADDLQECMNIFEEESLWRDIKAGQNRIENTIYLLQSDSTHLELAREQIGACLLEHRDKEEKPAPC